MKNLFVTSDVRKKSTEKLSISGTLGMYTKQDNF